jgi:hypothetical protein
LATGLDDGGDLISQSLGLSTEQEGKAGRSRLGRRTLSEGQLAASFAFSMRWTSSLSEGEMVFGALSSWLRKERSEKAGVPLLYQNSQEHDLRTSPMVDRPFRRC